MNQSQIATGLHRINAVAPNLPQLAGGSQRHRDPARLPFKLATKADLEILVLCQGNKSELG